MRERGQKGKHGETDGQIVMLIALNYKNHPEGLTKTNIHRKIEERTGKDREGIKRRITELSRNEKLKSILRTRNIGGRIHYSLEPRNILDISKIHNFLEPVINEKKEYRSFLQDYFADLITKHFTDLVDYLRLWDPKDKVYGLPERFFCSVGEEIPKDEKDPRHRWEGNDFIHEHELDLTPTESERMATIGDENRLLIEAGENEAWIVRETFEFDPWKFPNEGPFLMKERLRELNNTSMHIFIDEIANDSNMVLRLVYLFNQSVSEMEAYYRSHLTPLDTEEQFWESFTSYPEISNEIASLMQSFLDIWEKLWNPPYWSKSDLRELRDIVSKEDTPLSHRQNLLDRKMEKRYMDLIERAEPWMKTNLQSTVRWANDLVNGDLFKISRLKITPPTIPKGIYPMIQMYKDENSRTVYNLVNLREYTSENYVFEDHEVEANTESTEEMTNEQTERLEDWLVDRSS